MNSDDLVSSLVRSLALAQRISRATRSSKQNDENKLLIGQFGVGFYAYHGRRDC